MSNKNIVAVQFKDRRNPEEFGGREYTYFSNVDLKVGDVIVAPVGNSTGTVRVSRINVKDSEVDERILPKLRTIEELIRPEEKQKCRVCGCTWERACPGGCYWVEHDLCSACAEQRPERSD